MRYQRDAPVVAALCPILLFVKYHDDGIFPLLRHLAPPSNTNDDIEQSPAQGGITVEGDLEHYNSVRNFLHDIYMQYTILYCNILYSYQKTVRKERHINWSLIIPEKAAPVIRTTLRTTGPCAGRLSAVNVIGTQLRYPINSGLTQWRLTV